MLTNDQMQIHNRAVELARKYIRLESDLILALQEVDKTRLYKNLNRSSLFQYAVHELGLSEAVAYSFISVARKALEVPGLMSAVATQGLTVSKASRICSVLNAGNAKELIGFAKTHPSHQIDREVARRNPAASRPDKMRPLSEEYTRLELTVSHAVLSKLRRAQELESSRGTKGLADVLNSILDEYLKRKDPVKKAERALERKQDAVVGKTDSSRAVPTQIESPTGTQNQNELCLSRVNRGKRVSLAAEQKHSVFARDRGRCTHLDSHGARCESGRWLHIHHIKPVSRGGGNEPENLTTLCSFHHDLAHQLSLPIEGQVTWLRSPRIRYGGQLRKC